MELEAIDALNNNAENVRRRKHDAKHLPVFPVNDSERRGIKTASLSHEMGLSRD